MKNIHVLQTDKPSRLHLESNGLKLSRLQSTLVAQNIYITSDEEIKEGDWMIRDNEQPIKVTKNFFWDFGVRYYKIILTTDTRLAPDVQKISDEFLEWFVKNPSCEEVEVEKEKVDLSDLGHYEIYYKYKIIIPKEEPEQETTLEEIKLEEALGSKYCKYSIIENKLAIIYRNQEKILTAIKLIKNGK